MDQSPLIQNPASGNASSLNTSMASAPADVADTTEVTNTAPVSAPVPTPAAGKPNVLVVDDEADAAELFAELLNTTGKYNVQSAKDGLECLKKCEETKFDLVLLDIVMPNLDGVETLRQIKADSQKYGNPKVVMLTNIGGDIAIEKALELGAVGFKLKIDTEPEELLKAVEDALNGVPIKAPTQDSM